jgi:hypothetical protein
MLWHLFKDDAAFRELKPKTTMDYKSATKLAVDTSAISPSTKSPP